MPGKTSARSLVSVLDRVDRSVDFIERWTLILGILLMAALNIVNVLARNLLDNSLPFVGEVSQILIILVTFLGVGYAARQGRHIRMTALYDQLGERMRRWVMAAIALSTAALLFVLAWYALEYVLQTRQIGSVTAALRIPLYLVYAAAPLGLALGSVQYLLTAARNLLADRAYVSFRHRDEYDEEGTEGYI